VISKLNNKELHPEYVCPYLFVLGPNRPSHSASMLSQ
jgi:hypothetical protein